MTQNQVAGDGNVAQKVLQLDDGLAHLVGVVLNQFLDAQVTEQLQTGRVRAQSMLIVTRINQDGCRETPDLTTARRRRDAILTVDENRAPQTIRTLENWHNDATAELALPVSYRKQLPTTNNPEQLNQEIRRRERAIRILPNRESALRLIGAVLLKQDELWSIGHRYVRIDPYWAWNQQQDHSYAAVASTPAAAAD